MNATDPNPEVLLEIAEYDAVLRRGFLRHVDRSIDGRIHFTLGQLPESLKRPIIERSKILSSRRTLAREAFKALADEIHRSVIGTRLRARLSYEQRARPRLVKSSIKPEPSTAVTILHFWDLGSAVPTYSCGAEPAQGRNDHVIGDHRDAPSVARFAAVTSPCKACLTALLETP